MKATFAFVSCAALDVGDAAVLASASLDGGETGSATMA